MYLSSIALIVVVCVPSVVITVAATEDYPQSTDGQLIDDLTQIDQGTGLGQLRRAFRADTQ